MLVGLDVGGTHTDAALLARADGRLLAFAKAPTRPGDVLPGILEALQEVLRGRDPGAVRRVCVSSTLGLNALLTGRNDPAGLLVVPGPGIDPRSFWGPAPLLQVLPGAQDHRGNIVAAPEREDIWRALRHIMEHKARAVGIVCKFSPKNPGLENSIAEQVRDELGPDMPLVLGASAGGALNFPRRMHTVWCNASLARISRAFILSLEQAGRDLGLACPLVVLKADAGVFSARQAALDPASSMGSGPAASLLGTWALGGGQNAAMCDTLMIDMGGTTTDLAIMAGGVPLLSSQGLTVRGRPTLVRSLWTRSIALGGDSSLRLRDGQIVIGPDRSGPAVALSTYPDGPNEAAPSARSCLQIEDFASKARKTALFAKGVYSGGTRPEKRGPFDADIGQKIYLETAPRPETPIDSRPPTLTDALNVLGLADVGDRRISIAALARLAEAEPKNSDMEQPASGPGNQPETAAALARRFVDEALGRIRDEAASLLEEVNSRPVYTIRELLLENPIRPERAVLIGGPASALGPEAARVLGLPVHVPEQSPVANAVGAALARPTRSAELYADTLAGRMSIPGFGMEKRIGKNYNLEQARDDLTDAFGRAAHAERYDDESPDLTRRSMDRAKAGTSGNLQPLEEDLLHDEDLSRMQITSAESFAMLADDGARGRTIRLRAQQAAGLMPHPALIQKGACRGGPDAV